MVAYNHADLDADVHLTVLSAVAESMEESVMITEGDAGGLNPKILYVNPAFTRLTGYRADEVVGATPKVLQGGKTEREVLDRLKVELPRSHRWKGRTFNYMKSGQPFLMEWEIVPIHDTAGLLRFYVTVQRRMDGGSPERARRIASLRRWGASPRTARAAAAS